MKMKDLFGRSSTDPGQLTRVTGLPGDTVGPGDAVASSVQAVRTVPPASEHEPTTPVPTRLQRLAAASKPLGTTLEIKGDAAQIKLQESRRRMGQGDDSGGPFRDTAQHPEK